MSPFVLRAAVLAAVLLPATRAVPAPLSLDQAIALAVQASPMARSARAAAASAAETARAAGQQPDPMLTLGIDNLPASGGRRFDPNLDDMTMKRIGISQEWVPADKRAAREAVSEAVHRREAAMEAVAAAEARMQAAVAYVEAYYAGEALALAALDEQRAREAFEAGKRRLATPAGSGAEVLALSGALGFAEDESAELRQQRGASMAALQRWTGVPADELSEPRLPAVAAQQDFVAAHPRVVARERDVDVARQELALARLNRRPNWTYELSYGQRQGRPDLVSFGLSIPWPVAPEARQDRETAARLAMVERAEADAEEARRAAAGEYATLSNDVRRLEERSERFRRAVVEPLRQRSAAALAALRANQAGLVALFEARRAELEAGRRLLRMQRDLARARAQLAFTPVAAGAVR